MVRYSFDNSLTNINGTYNIHGWIYEVEVLSQVPEPGSILLLGAAALGWMAVNRRSRS